MTIKFKPMPWLSVIVAICIAILIGLGTWQYQRLQWKTALLADVEAAVTAPPFQSLSALHSAIEAGEPVDFRRIEFEADGYAQVTDETKPNGDERVPAQLVADSHIGYVRKVHDMGAVEAKIKSKASPDTNRWFRFNQSGDWGQGDVLTSHYIYITKMQSSASGILDAAELPIRRPDIRNNHFDYMLTWFSFALILLIIYFILHRRAGRLSFS